MTDKQQNEQKEELRDLDLPEEHADEVKGGAFGDIKGEAQDDKHAAQIEVTSWEWGLK